jgi:hypothetical protein
VTGYVIGFAFRSNDGSADRRGGWLVQRRCHPALGIAVNEVANPNGT